MPTMLSAPRGFPSMIRTDTSNLFAHNTFKVRVPAILRGIIELNSDYPPTIQDALKRLYDNVNDNERIPALSLPAPDADDWHGLTTERAGEHWQDTVWFFAEHYVYRLVIEAVRWWETGRDPFTPNKNAEYASPALWLLLESALAEEGSPETLIYNAVSRALWGNRIDLSYAPSTVRGHTATDDDLLVDHRQPVVEHLMRAKRPVHLIADNAGTELTMDLVLIDQLLTLTPVEQVMLHVKLHPTFVSDATVPDVLGFITNLETGQHSEAARALGGRLRSALESGRLRLAPDLFWNSARLMWEMPPRLIRLFSDASLLISKGDANYRRLLGDAVWAADTPFAQVVKPLPAPILALRTMKSDPLVGLKLEQAAHLDQTNQDWRFNGQYGLIQFAAK